MRGGEGGEGGVTGGGEGWSLKTCHVFADFFCFLKNGLLFIFADAGSWGSHSWSFFVDVINV